MESTGSENPFCGEIYYLKETEIKLLLAGLGLKQWYGLFSNEGVCMGQLLLRPDMLNRMLADLYQRNVITWEQEMVSLQQPYARMFMAMLKEKRCITMQASDGRTPVRCCYLWGRNVVVTQKSQREDGTVGMSELTVEGWLALAEEVTDALEEGAYLELAYRNSQSGECYQKIRVSREGIRSWRIQWENQKADSVCCIQEELKERLARLFGLSEKEGLEDR